ncbi:hypothetical protein MCP_0963 [Methanocella paludicola SANAE]|uniref:Uncharacterized protein n=1 Tax=Methanocella paludicola (strain DSM 17711 / JCM 13418 / NBRC 101707 / SANAE) TaxID=304371 RepID=D1YX63_METPS|nr:hypothetical protein [Methanocella paludicola]BAI61035.1 hypothetical protein MCP_0963 [Methanocella paludicola SANAE]
MSLSSDEIIKREIIDKLGYTINGLDLRIFPESSNDDMRLFCDDGLTFGVDRTAYGSCDACWTIKENWICKYNGKKVNTRPIIALEGTDALNRGSSGNAQYQRFHHALGAVKNGIIGIYYLRKGKNKIQEDLFGMAYFASLYENGTYLIIDDLSELKDLIYAIHDKEKLNLFINNKLKSMYTIFEIKFKNTYHNSWENFAKERSTVLKNGYVIKLTGRNKRNFTESSQRAGHIAVGEMYLTKYYFLSQKSYKKAYYLWPRMTRQDINYLDKNKSTDKEWRILRNEPNIEIITIDDLIGVPNHVRDEFIRVKDYPLKGEAYTIYNSYKELLMRGLESGVISINK